MNILHLKYAVEVEKTSSLNKAAENLFVSQPNLSRAVKELEETLGITIFKRTSKGMFPTEQGEEFLQQARGILAHIAEVESMYSHDAQEEQNFSVSVPRVSYIGDAFTRFVSSLDHSKHIDIRYKETNSIKAVNSILQSDYRLAIIRFRCEFEPYFDTMLYEKGLVKKVVSEFSHNVLISERNPLSQKEVLTSTDLEPLVQLSHGDPYVPGMPISDVKKAELDRKIEKRICIYERASQFELLSQMPDCYMMVSAVPEHILKKHGLKIVRSAEIIPYKDVLIHKKEYSLTSLDKRFLDFVTNSAKNLGLVKN